MPNISATNTYGLLECDDSALSALKIVIKQGTHGKIFINCDTLLTTSLALWNAKTENSWTVLPSEHCTFLESCSRKKGNNGTVVPEGWLLDIA